MKQNIIQEKTFEFSLNIIKLYKKLKDNNEFIISKQLLRSATSIWANIEEAIWWQSKKDFLAKVYTSLKEARETKYRLRLLQSSQIVKIDLENHIKEIEHIINILTKISKTTSSTLK